MKSLVALLSLLVALPSPLIARCKCFGSVKKSEPKKQAAEQTGILPLNGEGTSISGAIPQLVPVQLAPMSHNTANQSNTTQNSLLSQETTTIRDLDAQGSDQEQLSSLPRNPELFVFGPTLEHVKAKPKKTAMIKHLYDFFHYFCAASGAAMLGVLFLSHKYADRINKVSGNLPRHEQPRSADVQPQPAAPLPPANPGVPVQGPAEQPVIIQPIPVQPLPAAPQGPAVPVAVAVPLMQPPVDQPVVQPHAVAPQVPVAAGQGIPVPVAQPALVAPQVEVAPADLDAMQRLLAELERERKRFEQDRIDHNELAAKLAEQNRQLKALEAKIDAEKLFQPKPQESGSREADTKHRKALSGIPGLEDLPQIVFVPASAAASQASVFPEHGARPGASPAVLAPSAALPLPPSSASANIAPAQNTVASMSNKAVHEVSRKLDFDEGDSETRAKLQSAVHGFVAAAERIVKKPWGPLRPLSPEPAECAGPIAPGRGAEADSKERSARVNSAAGEGDDKPENAPLADIAEHARNGNHVAAPAPGPAANGPQITPNRAAEAARLDRINRINAALNDGQDGRVAEIASEAASAPTLNRGKIASF